MKKITLTKVFVNNSSKEGKPFKNPLVQIYFTDDKGVEHKASSFVGHDSSALAWKTGDTVELDFVKTGEYLNFKAPNKTDDLEKRIIALEAKVFAGKDEPAVDTDDLPF